MPIGGVYDVGTVAVTNGSATVVGTGVFWPDVLEGDHLVIAGLLSLVLSVNTGTNTVTLMKPYQGATNATASYQLVKMSWLRYDPSTVMYQTRDFLSRISDSNTGLFYYCTGTPDPAIGENGDLAIDVSGSLWIFWKKTAGVWVVQSPLIGPAGRTLLTANLTIFVRTDGNDANDGLVDSPSGAKATWQGAVAHVVQKIDTQGYNVTLRKGSGGSGTFTAGAIVVDWVGGGNILIDGGSSATCTINAPFCFNVTGLGGTLGIQNIKLIASAYAAVRHVGFGSIGIGNDVDFGACPSAHMEAHNTGAVINILGVATKISGGATVAHLWAHSGGAIYHEASSVAISGTPAIGAFAQANTNGIVQSIGSTFTGTVPTGLKFSVTSGGIIFTGSPGGINYFPGSSAGVPDPSTGGYYT